MRAVGVCSIAKEGTVRVEESPAVLLHSIAVEVSFPAVVVYSIPKEVDRLSGAGASAGVCLLPWG